MTSSDDRGTAATAAEATAWPPPLDADARAAGWRDAWAALALAPPIGLRERLEAAWGEPRRRYHDASHLGECLALLRRWQGAAERPAEVALALWFHDAVYDPRAADNEARSAAWARSDLTAAGAPADVARRVAGLVMATRHDAATPDAGRDAALLLDIDLAVLGSPPARFDRYDRDVRLEYAQVPEAAYRHGRAAVLRGFLARPRIYRLDACAALLEAPARANLDGAIARLEAGA